MYPNLALSQYALYARIYAKQTNATNANRLAHPTNSEDCNKVIPPPRHIKNALEIEDDIFGRTDTLQVIEANGHRNLRGKGGHSPLFEEC